MPKVSVDLMPCAGYFMIIKIVFDYTFLTGRQKRERGFRNLQYGEDFDIIVELEGLVV